MDADELFLSAAPVGETQADIEFRRGQDGAEAEDPESWLGAPPVSYHSLPMNAAAFREWAQLKHRRSDTLIEDAGMAAMHRPTVATRNLRDSDQLGVRHTA